MLRTGWVVVRRMTRGVAVAELDGEGGLGDQHGDGLVLVDAAEGDLLPTTMITPVLLARRTPGHTAQTRQVNLVHRARKPMCTTRPQSPGRYQLLAGNAPAAVHGYPEASPAPDVAAEGLG